MSDVAVGSVVTVWMQRVTMATRAKTPLSDLLDDIQPFPTFPETLLTHLGTWTCN